MDLDDVFIEDDDQSVGDGSPMEMFTKTDELHDMEDEFSIQDTGDLTIGQDTGEMFGQDTGEIFGDDTGEIGQDTGDLETFGTDALDDISFKRAREEDWDTHPPEPPQELEFGDNLIIDEEDEELLQEMDEVDRAKELSDRQDQWDTYTRQKEIWDDYQNHLAKRARVAAPRGDDFDPGFDANTSQIKLHTDALAFSDDEGAAQLQTLDQPSEPYQEQADEELEYGNTVNRHLGESTDEKLNRAMHMMCDMVLSRRKVESLLNLPPEAYQRAIEQCFLRIKLPVDGSDVTKPCLVEIKQIEEGAPYKIDGKSYKHLIRVRRTRNGKVSERPIPINLASDRPLEMGILVDEFKEWFKNQSEERVAEILDCLDEPDGYVNSKLRDLMRAFSFKFSEEMVKRILDSKDTTPFQSMSRLETEANAKVVEIHSNLEMMAIDGPEREILMNRLDAANKHLDYIRSMVHQQKIKFEQDNPRVFGLTQIEHRNHLEQVKMDDRRIFETREAKIKDAREQGVLRIIRLECQPSMMWDMGRRRNKSDSASSVAEKESEKPPADEPTTTETSKNDMFMDADSKVQKMIETHKTMNLHGKLDMGRIRSMVSRMRAQDPSIMRKPPSVAPQPSWKPTVKTGKIVSWEDYINGGGR